MTFAKRPLYAFSLGGRLVSMSRDVSSELAGSCVVFDAGNLDATVVFDRVAPVEGCGREFSGMVVKTEVVSA